MDEDFTVIDPTQDNLMVITVKIDKFALGQLSRHSILENFPKYEDPRN